MRLRKSTGNVALACEVKTTTCCMGACDPRRLAKRKPDRARWWNLLRMARSWQIKKL
jgi:hypothetical protein